MVTQHIRKAGDMFGIDVPYVIVLSILICWVMVMPLIISHLSSLGRLLNQEEGFKYARYEMSDSMRKGKSVNAYQGLKKTVVMPGSRRY